VSDISEPDRRGDLGRAAAARFQPQRMRPALMRRSALPRIGVLAGQIARFGELTGRSLLARRSVGAISSIGLGSTSSLPISVPRAEVWLPFVHRRPCGDSDSR